MDEEIDADDLLTFVPHPEREELREEARREAHELMMPRLLGKWPGWAKQYEIPDVERFDIVFDPSDLRIKFSCTDAHWKELWLQVNRNEPCECTIAAPQDIFRVLDEYVWMTLQTIGEPVPEPVTNPLKEGNIVAVITGNQCRYDQELDQIICSDSAPAFAKGPGFWGKNAPIITNARLLSNGLSSDVLDG